MKTKAYCLVAALGFILAVSGCATTTPPSRDYSDALLKKEMTTREQESCPSWVLRGIYDAWATTGKNDAWATTGKE